MTKAHFRNDIQGLRAVAVLTVFADHMLGWPAGGFLGVDVFFVISGFLITGLLLREYERTGHISFRSFYVGRLKRIVPAATVVLIFTVAFSWALFTQQRAISVSWDAVWAFLFGANWNFAIAGTDYFQQGTAVSPLQHYWSLSVEEQFYFVWPWLLLGLLVLFARFGQMTSARARAIAGSTIGLIVVASFGWAMVQTATQPTVAYFSTFTRAWELGIGALLAIAAPLFSRLPSASRPVIAYLGLAGIVASCFVIGPASAWPAPWALLPVVATALVIASGIGEEARFLFPLTNPVSVYIGNISYSLYLWHFPAIVFGHALYPQTGSLAYIGIVLVGFALATAQYYAIERPIWKSPLWKKDGSGSWRQWWTDHVEQVRYGLAGGFVTLTIAVVGVAFLPAPAPVQAAAPEPDPSASSASATEGPAVAAVHQQVRDALASTAWPAGLQPSIDRLDKSASAAGWVKDGCLALEDSEGSPEAIAERCVYGDPGAPNTALLTGDSIAISWLPAIQGALGSDWKIHVMTMQQCPFAFVDVKKADGSPLPECTSYHEYVKSQAGGLAPKLTILAQADNSGERIVRGGPLAAGTREATAYYGSVSERVAVLPAPPMRKAVVECYSAAGSPSACTSSPSAAHLDMNRMLASTTAETPNATFLDTDGLFCANGSCPAYAGGVVMFVDVAHLTQAYGEHLADAIGEMLPKAGQ